MILTVVQALDWNIIRLLKAVVAQGRQPPQHEYSNSAPSRASSAERKAAQNCALSPRRVAKSSIAALVCGCVSPRTLRRLRTAS